MRIAVVHSFYADGPSGENNVVNLQVASLRRAGHEVKLVSKSSNIEKAKTAFEIRAGLTVATGFGASPVKALESFRPDVVHVHNLFPNWSERWVSSVRFPMVVTLHNFRPLCSAGTLFLNGAPCNRCLDSGSFQSIINRCYRSSRIKTVPLAVSTHKPRDNRLLNRADKLVLLSMQSRDVFLKSIPALRQKDPIVIPNFAPDVISQAVFQPCKFEDSEWLFIGRLSPEKGILELIKAWPPEMRLCVAGTGPQYDSVLEACRGKNIEILGAVAPPQVEELLQQSCGVILPSLWKEHNPMVFVEAMRAGIPVLAKSGNSVATSVEEHGGGVVFHEFQDLMGGLKTLHGKRRQLSQEALGLFQREFSESVWLARMEKTYRRTISELKP